jgi:hypothetical protein
LIACYRFELGLQGGPEKSRWLLEDLALRFKIALGRIKNRITPKTLTPPRIASPLIESPLSVSLPRSPSPPSDDDRAAEILIQKDKEKAKALEAAVIIPDPSPPGRSAEPFETGIDSLRGRAQRPRKRKVRDEEVGYTDI